jgi:hypothetical protein
MEFRVLSSSYYHNNRLSQDSETGEWEMSGSQSLIFEVTPDGLYDIEFDDGNRFRGYRKLPSVKEKDNEIYIAKLCVQRSDITGNIHNQFVKNESGQKIYRERYISYDPDINTSNDLNDELMCVVNINCKIPGCEFDEILNFIRNGINPTKISMYFGTLMDSNVLFYGLEPKSFEWDTKNGFQNGFEDISFEFKDIIDGPELDYLDPVYKQNIKYNFKNIDNNISSMKNIIRETNRIIYWIIFLIFIFWFSNFFGK